MEAFVLWVLLVAAEVAYLALALMRTSPPPAPRLAAKSDRIPQETRALDLSLVAYGMGLEYGWYGDLGGADGPTLHKVATSQNQIWGTWKGIFMLAADCLLPADQAHQPPHLCTVFFVHGAEALPAFSLHPAPNRHITNPHFPPSFSHQYGVESPNLDSVCRVLKADVQAWLEAFPGWFVMVEGSWLVLHRNTVLPADRFETVFNEAWMLTDLLGVHSSPVAAQS